MAAGAVFPWNPTNSVRRRLPSDLWIISISAAVVGPGSSTHIRARMSAGDRTDQLTWVPSCPETRVNT
jgi:hypothetical protein